MLRAGGRSSLLLVLVACNRGDGATPATATKRVTTSSVPTVSTAPKPVAPPSTFPCDDHRPVEGRSASTITSWSKPAKGAVHEDRPYRTCFIRATDHAREKIPSFSRNDYSRRQAFNADSSSFITSVGDGTWRLYDTQTLQGVLGPPELPLAGDAEPQWHPTDPNLLYFGENNGGLKIMAFDVRRRSTRVASDLRGKFPWPSAARAWSKSEGSPSRDARFWPFQVETEDFKILGFAVWDAVEQRIVGSMATQARPDHVSMSPSGRWFVSSGDETTAWSSDFKTHKVLRKGGEHSDLASGANGHDYYVSIDYQSNDGVVFMTDIDTGERTDLFATYVDHGATAMHVSGKAFDKPGWVLVSTYDGYGPKQWFHDKLFAMELAKNPRIYQLAAHHSAVGSEYFAEPQATVNRDFTRILFNSNWGVKESKDIDAYLLRLPPNAFP